MLKALLLHVIAVPVFALQLLRAIPAEGWRYAWKRLPLFFLVWCVFTLLNFIHLCGHLIDEVLFFSYRKIRLVRPVFILGIPRSGTTFLQRLLCKDSCFTTFTTWEALLAPSISEKYLYHLLGSLLLPLLRPLEKLTLIIRRKLFHNMDTIHQLRLQEPEEDFLLLLPVLGCLLPVFLCPDSKHYWALGYFDSKLSPVYKETLLAFYTQCLKKHLYYAGGDLRLLSKNPSFTSWTGSLLTRFPDARIIACIRQPDQTIASQLSSLRPAMALLAGGNLGQKTQNRMIELLYSYYLQLGRLSQNKRVYMLPMAALQKQLKTTIEQIYESLAIQPSDHFMKTVVQLELQSRNYSSGHKYNLATFSLSDKMINEKFRHVWPLTTQNPAQE